MYTGTLIKDLMATVERAERSAQLKKNAEEVELHQLFNLPAPEIETEPVFAGAA
jgi:hypothetical protein